MNNLFLQSLPIESSIGDPIGNLMGAFMGIFLVFILIFFTLYIYLSIVYSKIGIKAKLSNPGIAWMPYGGWLAIIFESSKMHWWPFLMMVGGIAGGYILMLSSSIVGITAAILAGIVLFATGIISMIMITSWHWKTYEAIGKPGWWILVPVISGIFGYALMFLGGIVNVSIISISGIILGSIGIIAHLILISIAAFSNS